jgi:hypothetical protein
MANAAREVDLDQLPIIALAPRRNAPDRGLGR